MNNKSNLAFIGSSVAILLRKTVEMHPPANANRVSQVTSGKSNQKLGAYLCSLGYITPLQLRQALLEQQYLAKESDHWRLGDLLVKQGLLHPQVLVAALLIQMTDHLFHQPDMLPRFLGERLVAMGVISPLELAPALIQQTWLRQTGHHVRLGDLLVQHGSIKPQVLSSVILFQNQRIACPITPIAI
ncbi:MAG: hypothetical protein AAGF95_17755 [Chloroflexota bacterium]